MKFALLGLFVSFNAFAVLNPPGTFEPDMCAYTNFGSPGSFRSDVIAVDEVCKGSLAGLNQQAVQVIVNDGSVRVYAITVKDAAKGKMGIQKLPFKGENVEDSSDKIKGNLYFSSGITTAWSIELETTGNLKFEGNLERVVRAL